MSETTEALTEAQPAQPDAAAVPAVDYETAGETPERTITRRENGEIVMMMTEIGDGVFVAWDRCNRCAVHIRDCVCAGGPKERDVIARWREERKPKPSRYEQQQAAAGNADQVRDDLAAVESGDLPSGSVVAKVTGENSLHTAAQAEADAKDVDAGLDKAREALEQRAAGIDVGF